MIRMLSKARVCCNLIHRTPIFLSESHGDEVCFDFWSTALPAQAKIDPICCPTRPLNKILVPFWGCSRNVPTNTPVTFKEEYTPGVRDFSVVKIFNRPFYPYGGHIEFIRFKEYYGMPRWHLFSIYARFSDKMTTSLYISREKGVRYYIQTRHNDLFFPLQLNLFRGKLIHLIEKSWPKKRAYIYWVSISDCAHDPWASYNTP